MAEIEFVGGRLCFDFVNTANWIDDRAVDDRLTDRRALEIWAGRKKIAVTADEFETIEGAVSLRLAVRRLFSAPQSVTGEDLAVLAAARSGDAVQLTLAERGVAPRAHPSVRAVLRLIADSAVEAMISINPSRIRVCQGDRCGWLFVDESPNNRRQWCSMATCGNRAKARAHYRARRRSD